MKKTPPAATARLLAAALLFALAAPAHSAPRPAAQTRDVKNAKPVTLTFEDGTSVKLYGQSHALVIGVSDYTQGWLDLPGVETDVREVSAVLARQGFEVVMALNPTSSSLDRMIRDFVNEHGQDEDARLVIYFAGHGHTLKLADGRELGFIVPADAPLPDPRDQRAFFRAAVSMDDIRTHALRITSKHALFVFDSCFSGSLFEADRAAPPAITIKAAQPVRQFITAGTAEQVVPDRSLFREQFVEALAGAGDRDGDGYVTGSELGYFLETRVTNYTEGAQTPRFGKIRNPKLDKGDFVFETPHTPAPAVVRRPPDAQPTPTPAAAQRPATPALMQELTALINQHGLDNIAATVHLQVTKYEGCTLVVRSFLDERRQPYIDITVPFETVRGVNITPYKEKYLFTIYATDKTLYEHRFFSPETSYFSPAKQIVFDTSAAAERAKELFGAEQARCAGAPK